MTEKQIQEVMALVKELAQYAPYTTGVRYCAAIERALREQVREVPEGWMLVPVEPTNEMVQAGKVCASAQMVWREMLSAAPTQPAQIEKDPLICDCKTEIYCDGNKETRCGSDQMRRAANEGHSFRLQAAGALPAWKARMQAAGDANDPGGNMARAAAQAALPNQQLLTFYQATDYQSLVSAMEHHINKLQAKTAALPSFAPQHTREGRPMTKQTQPAQAMDVCETCEGTGVEGDAGPRGETIDVVCSECNGRGKTSYQLSDAEVIQRAEAAGFRYLKPDEDPDGFPGGFDLEHGLTAMRRLLTSQTAQPKNKPTVTIDLGEGSPFTAKVVWSDWDQEKNALNLCVSLRGTQPAQAGRCPNCDDTGHVHSFDGEWRGICHCPAGQKPAQVSQPKAEQQEPVALDHIACIDDGELRYVTGRKAPAHDCELYALPGGGLAPVLYTAAAPQREPMTREQRRRIIDEALFNTEGLTQDDFAQEIVSGVERFHNITRAAMSLTDEQINDAYGAALVQHGHIPHDDVVRIARAIESATAAPLLERIRQLEQAVKWEADLCQQALESRAELEQQLEAARKDAERYRWLRSEKTGHCKAISILEAVGDGGQVSVKCCEDLDAAIDAAISKEQA